MVENNLEVRSFLRDALEEHGYAVTEAGTTAAARELLDHQQFAAVLTDVVLPGRGEDGISLAQWALDKGLPTVVITGSPAVVNRIEARGFRYLMKPFRIDDLLHTIREVLTSTTGRSSQE